MTKPFNLEHARAGAPVQTDNGHPARIVAFDRETICDTQLVVLILFPDGGEAVRTANPFGRIQHNETLVMAPLATIDGREVYTGDVLCYKHGVGRVHMEVRPGDAAEINRPDMFFWPDPVYPETKMTAQELHVAAFGDGAIAFYATPPDTPSSLAKVANAAIEHGIQNGYLYDAARVDKLLIKLLAQASVPPSLTPIPAEHFLNYAEKELTK